MRNDFMSIFNSKPIFNIVKTEKEVKIKLTL